jgi:hypothetical protein
VVDDWDSSIRPGARNRAFVRHIDASGVTKRG